MSPECYVLGVDISPGGSPRSSRAPRFSIVGLDRGGRVVYRDEEVSLRALVGRVWRLRPSMIAVDNVYEVARDPKDLLRLLRLLPEGTRLIQVTGPPRSARQLVEVAASHGLKVPSRLSPIQAAEVSARLALMGVGCEVRAFEPEVRIVISRARSYGAGGMSLERFRRDARSLVLYATRELCEELRSRGLDFDVFTRPSRRGLERSVVVVYASMDSLRDVIRSVEERGVKVKVYTPPSSDLQFVERGEPQPGRGRYLIVGVDPGMVTGLAAITLDGRPVLLASRRSMDRLSICRELVEHGCPLIVASDVSPPPALVARIASTLNAVLYAPPSPLTVEEKRRLVEEFEEAHGVRVEDSHQRDALAAAIKAYMNYKNKFEQAESHVRSLGAKVPLEEVKAMVVRGHSIQDAIKRLSEPKQAEEPRPPPAQEAERLKVEVKALQEKVARRDEYIERLEAERRRLLSRIGELTSRVEELERELDRERGEQARRARLDAEVRKLEARVEALKSQLARAEEERSRLLEELSRVKGAFKACVKGELRALKPLNALTPRGVAEAVESYGLGRGDVVYVREAASACREAAEELARLKVAAVVSPARIPSEARLVLVRHAIPIVEGWGEVEWVDGVPLVKASDLERAIDEASRRVEGERASLLRESLSRVLEEYRRERAAELLG